MNARRIVSRVMLDEWLTAEIHKVPGGENCALASKYIVGEPKKNNGCNWAGLTIRMGEGAIVQAVVKAAAAIEQRASLLFNLDVGAPRLRVDAFSVQMSRRLLYTPVFHLDADLIEACQRLPEVRQLEKWREDGVILLNMSGVAYDDARAGGDRLRAREAAPHRADQRLLMAAEEVIFVKATKGGQRNDARIACDSIERHAIPIDCDAGSKSAPSAVSGCRADLRRLGANIMSAPRRWPTCASKSPSGTPPMRRSPKRLARPFPIGRAGTDLMSRTGRDRGDCFDQRLPFPGVGLHAIDLSRPMEPGTGAPRRGHASSSESRRRAVCTA